MAPEPLGEVPQDADQFEDYVASLFHSAGFFVETNLIHREETEILELDAVASDYREGMPYRHLVEAKSGGWGFKQVFKVLGWLTYLGLEHGSFFVQTAPGGKDPQSVQEKVKDYGIRVVHLADYTQAAEIFKEAGFPEPTDDLLLSAWRYANLIEREYIRRLRSLRKDSHISTSAIETIAYYRHVNNEAFFTEDARDRLWGLYREFQEHPYVSGAMAQEIQGGKFDPKDPGRSKAFGEALFRGRHWPVQAAFFVEQRARLSILKAAIDYICLMEAGVYPAEGGTGSVDWPSITVSLLPDSFHDAIDAITAIEDYTLLPLFWQYFLFAYGGFYLENREDEFFNWMEAQVGLPAEEIPAALQVFDVLFPGPEWLTTLGRTDLRILKMVPAQYRGLGVAHHRQRLDIDDFQELSRNYDTMKHLTIWNNAFVEFLRPDDG